MLVSEGESAEALECGALRAQRKKIKATEILAGFANAVLRFGAIRVGLQF
jgi:hypothetical protein